MTKWIVGVAASLALWAGVAVPAAAAPFTPMLEADYRIAIEFWGREPTECSTIDKEIVSVPELEGASGFATIPRGVEPEPCVLFIRRDNLGWNVADFACGVMIHEVGHLLGYQHSADPHSPMYPGAAATNPPPCVRVGELADDVYSERERLHQWQIRCARRPDPRCWAQVRRVSARLRLYLERQAALNQ